MKVNEMKVKNAMKHADKLGAGAKKRKSLNPKEKMKATMGEFGKGTLYSGSGHKVTDKRQALAIAFSEAREAIKRKRAIAEKKK